MKTHQLLIDARALIADRERWIQGDFARTVTGCAIGAEKPNAHCFCAVGAVRHAGRNLLVHEVTPALDALDRAATSRFLDISIVDANDHRNHAAVLACFDDAIKATAPAAPAAPAA